MSIGRVGNMSMDEISTGITSADEILQLEAARALRKMLSRDGSLKDTIIPKESVLRCIDFLSFHHNPVLQFESLWVLTNVAAGTSEQTMIVVNNGAIPKLVELLKSPDADVAEQAVWALGNIAGDGSETRDQVLEHNCMPPLLNLIYTDTPVSLTRNIVWAISNLCRNNNSPPSFEMIKEALPILNYLLTGEDPHILTCACYALSYLTDGENHEIQAVVDCGVVPKLVTLLASPDLKVLMPALRTVGNIATGNDIQTDAIINAGAVENLKTLLQHTNPNIVKEATWTLGNIIAGTREQVQHVIDAGVMPLIAKVMSEGDADSKREAAWIIEKLFTGLSDGQFSELIQQGFNGELLPLRISFNAGDEETDEDVCLRYLLNDLSIADDVEEKGGNESTD